MRTRHGARHSAQPCGGVWAVPSGCPQGQGGARPPGGLGAQRPGHRPRVLLAACAARRRAACPGEAGTVSQSRGTERGGGWPDAPACLGCDSHSWATLLGAHSAGPGAPASHLWPRFLRYRHVGAVWSGLV